MSLTAIINLAERLLNNAADQPVEANSSLRQSKQNSRAKSDARVEDQFTPSSASQHDAGLFQVRQISIFSAAAEFFLSQTAQSQANPDAASPTVAVNAAATPVVAQPAPAPDQNASQALVAAATAQPTAAHIQSRAQTFVAANSFNFAQFSVLSSASTARTATVPVTLATAPGAATANATANSTQGQLLALNTALQALGLNSSQLAQVDQVATLIKDFNPVAFTSLVFQLEALAQANAQTGAAANSPVSGTSAPVAKAGTTAGTNNQGGFQIQELVIKFSGVQESFSQTGSGAQGGNSSVQLSAFNLQVEEVNLTLANQAGQSLQVTAPPSTATQQLAATTAAQAKSVAA